jgi:hypothetical protein
VRVTDTKVSVVLSGGGTVSAPIVDADVPNPALSGSYDIDLDGRVELFVETTRGASTTFVSAYRFDGNRLFELTYQGGHLPLGFGGSVTHGDGFTCTHPGRLQVTTAESDDGSTYRVRTVTYRVVGASFVRIAETSVTAASMDDPRVRAAYEVDCGSVGEGH